MTLNAFAYTRNPINVLWYGIVGALTPSLPDESMLAPLVLPYITAAAAVVNVRFVRFVGASVCRWLDLVFGAYIEWPARTWWEHR